MRIYIGLILHCCLLVGTCTRTTRSNTGPERFLSGGDQHFLSGKVQPHIENDEYSSRDQQLSMFDNGLTKAVQWSAACSPHCAQVLCKVS